MLTHSDSLVSPVRWDRRQPRDRVVVWAAGARRFCPPLYSGWSRFARPPYVQRRAKPWEKSNISRGSSTWTPVLVPLRNYDRENCLINVRAGGRPLSSRPPGHAAEKQRYNQPTAMSFNLNKLLPMSLD